ncbi:hypothetical protein PWR66_03245 [Paraburkholderia sp. A1RO-5]|uniref:hypothetical protein n=1 Tax=Paraburkholderia sp. A1RO-5 TaxID=3028369 RepID=UPI003B7E46D0
MRELLRDYVAGYFQELRHGRLKLTCPQRAACCKSRYLATVPDTFLDFRPVIARANHQPALHVTLVSNTTGPFYT